MPWFSSTSEEKVEAHNRGQQDGANAGPVEYLAHCFSQGFNCTEAGESYDQGFSNGANNPSSK